MASTLAHCRSVIAHLADAIFPRTCAACSAALAGQANKLCDTCAALIPALISPDYCGCCGKDVGPHLLVDSRCTTCQNKRPWFDQLRRVGRYTNPMSNIIIRFKYGRDPTLDAMLGDWLADAVTGAPAFASVQFWVPIPSPRIRLWQRGYQPTRLLADHLAQRTGRPRRSILRLARRINEQKKLPDDARVANVKDAFGVVTPHSLDGMTIGLVDDVLTTGATMREAARTLRGAGAERVLAVVLATARPGFDR